LAGIQAARERLGMSYARAEAGGSGKHLPSYFFRAVAEALEGGRLSLDEVEGSRHVRRFPPGATAATGPESRAVAESTTRGSCAHRSMVRRMRRGALERAMPSFGRAIAARRDRWSRALTPYDGVMESAEALRMAGEKSDFRRGVPVSPSRLEMYARCRTASTRATCCAWNRSTSPRRSTGSMRWSEAA
jgi:hypothetical protein